jgi:hypothetical protein
VRCCIFLHAAERINYPACTATHRTVTMWFGSNWERMRGCTLHVQRRANLPTSLITGTHGEHADTFVRCSSGRVARADFRRSRLFSMTRHYQLWTYRRTRVKSAHKIKQIEDMW